MLFFVCVAYKWPEVFLPFKSSVSLLLGLVMFGMGLTLNVDDFKEILKRPQEVFLGVFLQYSLMPLIALGLCYLFSLPKELALGVILVGSCPGGTSSNVLTYLARGDVALSVTLTSVSTLLAPIVTPLLVSCLAKQWIQIDPYAMVWSIVQIVLLPVLLGVVLQTFFREKISPVVTVLPLFSVITIILIVGVVVATTGESLVRAAPLLFLTVILHNGLGLFLGYFVANVFKLSSPKCTCVSIEVGTQNAGLGATLSMTHFATMPMVAVPSAIFSFWNIIAGSLVASVLLRKNTEKKHL